MQITLRPWAKINLYLKILGKRSDGYHEIRTLIHPIALFDELTIKRIRDGLIINCRLEGLPIGQDVPPKKDNLVTRAVKIFFERIGEPPKVEIDLVKRIPINGGLGGGSSDAANTLLGLNQLFEYPLAVSILNKICLELGMDVPFFLEQKPAICTGRGEIIEKRIESVRFFCVLVNPGKGLATKDVYKMFNLDLTGRKTMDNIFDFVWPQPINKVTVYNDLENPAISLCPEIRDILELLKRTGVIKSFVCGSGSTVCGLVENKEEAEEVMRKIEEERDPGWWIKAISSL